MGPALRRQIKAIEANANKLKPVSTAKVVEMPIKEENNDIAEIKELPTESVPEVQKTQIYHSHGLGYSSRSRDSGYGLTPIFHGFRVPSPGDEKW